MAERRSRLRRATGPARVIALAYGFFTLAAGARSAVQLATHPHDALFAYVLSGLAACVYAAGTVLIASAERGHLSRAATVVCAAEVAGVLLVGTLSLLVPAWFPDATVWSGYGSGYGFVPAVLPVLALVWLRHGTDSGAPAPPAAGEVPQAPVSPPAR